MNGCLAVAAVVACVLSVVSAHSSPVGRGTNLEEEFTVEFFSPRLGMQLTEDLAIKQFVRDRATPLPAEASQWLKVGDTLLEVNEVPVAGMRMHDTVTLIAKADLPKVLKFRAVNGEHRAAAMAAFAAGQGNFTAATGRLEVMVDGLPAGSIRFVRAMFGPETSCSRAKIVVADPASGCEGFANEADIANSIVVVQRGGCSFDAKAVNVQNADGFAVVVVNNRGAAIRMPQAASHSPSVLIPSVMISEGDDVSLQTALMMHHHSPIVGRFVQDGLSCDLHSPRDEAAKKKADEEAAQAAAEKEAQDADHDADLVSALEQLLDVNAWPAGERARRRLFFRLSKLHHPDKPNGSHERFELLSQAYELVTKHYERD